MRTGRDRPMKRRTITTLATAAFLVLLCVPLAAQLPVTVTPRALGAGGAYMGMARGHEALHLNPANLGLPGTPYWSVALGQINLAGTAFGPDLFDIWDIARASKVSQARRDELLALLPGTGLTVDSEISIPAISVQNRNFAFGVSYGALSEYTVGRDLVELFVEGYERGRTDYRVGDTGGTRATHLEFTAGYGRSLGPVSLGVTGRYIRGRTLSRSRLFEPRFDLEAGGIEVEYQEVMARGGNGYGLDLGLAYQPLPELTLSAAVSNVITDMRWNETLTTRSLVIDQDDFGASSRHWESMINTFARTDEPVSPDAVPLTVYETAQGLYDDAYFPSTLRLGTAYALPETGTQLGASYYGTLSGGVLKGMWDRALSVGVQQSLPWITARAGLATDLDGASMISGGLSLGPVELGVARLAAPGSESLRRRGWVGAFGLNVGTTTFFR